MKLTATLISFFIGLALFGQSSSFTVFNNNGQQFFVIMNGIRQNSLPHTNVQISGVMNGVYDIKLIFADGKTGDINKRIWLEQPGDYTARVVIKGSKRKLQFAGAVPASQIPGGGSGVQYRANDQVVYSDQAMTNGEVLNQPGQVTYQGGTVQNQQQNQGSGQVSTTTNGQPTGTITTTSNGQYGGSINVNIPDQGIQADPTMTGQNGVYINTSGSIPVTTSTSTTTSSSTTQNGQVVNDSYQYQQSTSVTQNGQTTTTTQTSGYGNPPTGQASGNYNGNYGNQGASTTGNNGTATVSGNNYCTQLLSNPDLFIEELKNESFENDKRKMIEKDLVSTCVTADQAYRIVNALTFDADRIDMSMFLYDRMADKINGKRLLDLLTFDADKQKYRDYMRTH